MKENVQCNHLSFALTIFSRAVDGPKTKTSMLNGKYLSAFMTEITILL